MWSITIFGLLFAAACGGQASPPNERPTVSVEREIESAPPTTPVEEEAVQTSPRRPSIEPVASVLVSELDERSGLVGLSRVGDEWHVSVISRSETDGPRVGRLARHPVRDGRLGEAVAEVTLEHLHAVSVLPAEDPWFLERAITLGTWRNRRPVTIRPAHAGIRAGVLARDAGEARWLFSTPRTDRWRTDAWRPGADAPDGYVITWREGNEVLRMHRVGPRAGGTRVIRVGRASGSARVRASASQAGVAVVYPTGTGDGVHLHVQSYDHRGRRRWAWDIVNPALSEVRTVSMGADGQVFVVLRRPGALVLVAFDAAGDARPEVVLSDGANAAVGLFECGDTVHLITAENGDDRRTMHVHRREIASDGTLSEGVELLRTHQQPVDPDGSLPDTLEIATPFGSCAEGRAAVAFESTDPRGDGVGRVLMFAEWEIDAGTESSTDGAPEAPAETPAERSESSPTPIGHGGGSGCYDCGAGGLENARPRRIRVTPAAPSVRGELPPAVARRVVRQHLRALRACYEAELRSRPDIEGEVTLRWIVRHSGEAAPVSVSRSTLGVMRIETCMTDEVRTWRFPPREGEAISIVDVVFTLSRQL